MIYSGLKKNPSPIKIVKNRIICTFVEGAQVEILGEEEKKYLAKFINKATNQVVYQTELTNNTWGKATIKYFIDWKIEVYEGDELIFTHDYNPTDKRVFITITSSALGDTLAWIPYALEFKNKHNCHVIISTFKNELFRDVYPELEFVNPGSTVHNIYAQYNIGWFYDHHKEPTLPNTIPLQQTATNILGLDYQEIKPRIVYTPRNKFDGKIVTIATNSTAGCKFWTREAWQELIYFLDGKGYRVINVSKEDNPFEKCQPLDDKSMQNTMDAIASSEFFIGLSSGLSWLVWTLGRPVVMISNFSEEWHEFSCIRVTNKSVCHGCWNNPNFKFDKGDWDWCPINKNTPKHFECHRSISGKDVIETICSHFQSL